MRVLIVDDQIHVVNGIVNGVDWKSLGVEEPLTAYNAFEAVGLKHRTIQLSASF